MSIKPKQFINIIDGPGVDRLLDALKYSYDKVIGADIAPAFKLDLSGGAGTMHGFAKCKVVGIEYESGSPGMFILTLFFDGDRRKAFYNANKRKGFIKPVSILI